jgi:predicted PurR-regulated permease PerM
MPGFTILYFVCLIIIALSMVAFAVASIIVALEIKKTRENLSQFIEKLDREIVPLTVEIRQIAEDVRSVTKITRYQLERIDSSINYASNNLIAVIDGVVRTINTVRHGILSPFNNIAAILKGVSRGVEYFFRNK